MFFKRGRKIYYIALLIGIFVVVTSVFLLSNKAICYDTKVAHPNIARLAAELYNQNFPNQKLTEAEIKCIEEGAIEEDTPTRWMNHFYDPVYNRGIWFGKQELSAKEWYNSNSEQRNYSLGDYTWNRALIDLKSGNREEAFKGLGHLIHLLSDMTVPAHTRDDIHILGDSYEQFVKNNWQVIAGVLSASKFTYLSNLNTAFDDLANFSNNNFYSDDTIGDKNYNFPFLDNTKIVNNYVNNEVDEKIFKLVFKNDSFLKSKKIDPYFLDDTVLIDYSKFLIPKAVGYSAGAIKLFLDEADKSVNNNVDGPKVTLQGYENLFLGKIIAGAEDIYKYLKGGTSGGNTAVGETPPVLTSLGSVNSTQAEIPNSNIQTPRTQTPNSDLPADEAGNQTPVVDVQIPKLNPSTGGVGNQTSVINKPVTVPPVVYSGISSGSSQNGGAGSNPSGTPDSQTPNSDNQTPTSTIVDTTSTTTDANTTSTCADVGSCISTTSTTDITTSTTSTIRIPDPGNTTTTTSTTDFTSSTTSTVDITVTSTIDTTSSTFSTTTTTDTTSSTTSTTSTPTISSSWILSGDLSVTRAAYFNADHILTLTTEHSPYIIDYHALIPTGYKVVADPGTVFVGRDKSSYLTVQGGLDLLGNALAPIIFTSALDSNYVTTAVTSTLTGSVGAGDWSRIEIDPGGSVIVNYTKFLYGGQTFKKDNGWVYGTKFISNVLRNIGGSLSLDNVEINNSFIDNSTDTKHECASIWVETDLTHSANLTVQNSIFDNGYTAINLVGLDNGQKILTTINDNTFQNYTNPDGVIISNLTFPSITNNNFSNNQNDYLNLGIFSLSNDYTLSENTKYVFSNLTVGVGKTLTIEPGVDIKLSGDIDVQGSLEANGTSGNPINIMSKSDYWGIMLLHGPSANLQYVNLTKGNKSNSRRLDRSGMVTVENSTTTFDNVNFMDAERPFNMIYILNSNVTLKDSIISWTDNYTRIDNIDGINFNGGNLHLNNVTFNRMNRGVEINTGLITAENMSLGSFQNIKDLNWWPMNKLTL